MYLKCFLSKSPFARQNDLNPSIPRSAPNPLPWGRCFVENPPHKTLFIADCGLIVEYYGVHLSKDLQLYQCHIDWVCLLVQTAQVGGWTYIWYVSDSEDSCHCMHQWFMFQILIPISSLDPRDSVQKSCEEKIQWSKQSNERLKQSKHSQIKNKNKIKNTCWKRSKVDQNTRSDWLETILK